MSLVGGADVEASVRDPASRERLLSVLHVHGPVVGPSTVAAQRAVLAAAGGDQMHLAGQAISAKEWWQALRYLTAMARFGLSPHQFAADYADDPVLVAAFAAEHSQRLGARTGADRQLGGMPGTAQVAAALLAAVFPVMAAADEPSCMSVLESLTARVVARRRELGHNALRGIEAPPSLQALLGRVTPAPSRLAGHLRAAGRPRWQIRHIPHLIDAGDFGQLFTGVIAGKADTGRRIAAVGLARLAGAGSWQEAIDQLGMPRRWHFLDSHIPRSVADPHVFSAAVAAAGQQLVDRGLVDYAARRHALRALRVVPYQLMFDLCHPLGFPVTSSRQRHAAAWVWAQLTGGDIREAPALTPRRTKTAWATASTREVSRRFAAWLPAPAAAALAAWGEALLEAAR